VTMRTTCGVLVGWLVAPTPQAVSKTELNTIKIAILTTKLGFIILSPKKGYG